MTFIAQQQRPLSKTPARAGAGHQTSVSTERLLVFTTTDPTVLYPLQGDWELSCGGHLLPLHQGQTLGLNRSAVVRAVCLNASRPRLLMVSFSLARLRRVLQLPLEAERLLLPVALPPSASLARQLTALGDGTMETAQDADDQQRWLDALFVECLHHNRQAAGRINRLGMKSSEHARDLYLRLQRARDFMRARYMNDPGVEALSDIAHLSRSRFMRLYKLAFGTSPHKDLVAIKIEAAARLLRERRVSVSEAGEAAGFGNRSAFSRLFKYKTGMSPSAYRRMKNRH